MKGWVNLHISFKWNMDNAIVDIEISVRWIFGYPPNIVNCYLFHYYAAKIKRNWLRHQLSGQLHVDVNHISIRHFHVRSTSIWVLYYVGCFEVSNYGVFLIRIVHKARAIAWRCRGRGVDQFLSSQTMQNRPMDVRKLFCISIFI